MMKRRASLSKEHLEPEPLSASQARLEDDLRGLIDGDARCDDVALQLYSFDGSPFEERPAAVVWPRSSRDVAAVMVYAKEKGLSVHPRGAGTSGVASAIGAGIVLDFSRYMRRVLQAGEDFVRVQPGAVRERVNDQLRATKGRFFAPSSGHIPTGTIGSILSVDNIGPRWLRYGSPHESVLNLKIVSANGEIWDLRPFPARLSATPYASEPMAVFRRRFLNAVAADANDRARRRASGASSADGSNFNESFARELGAAPYSARASEYGVQDGEYLRFFDSEFARDLYFRRVFGDSSREVASLVRSEPWSSALGIIRDYERFLESSGSESEPLRSAFSLRDVVRFGFDPTRYFTGSEGSLGIIVEATVATTSMSGATAAAILLFESTEDASRAVSDILDFDPTLCDLLDSRVIALTRDWDSRFETIFPQGAQCALVVELDADDPTALRARMDALQRRARETLRSYGGWTAFSLEDRGVFRELLQKSSCARLRMAPSFQHFPYWDDARLPVESIPDFLLDIQELFKREQIVYSVGGHVGCGQLSIQPILPYSDEKERRAFELSDRFEDLVLSYGGEIGAAKGNGRVRTAAIPKRFPNLFPAFVRTKDVFDPDNRLNPDCVVSPEMRRLAAEGRGSATAEPTPDDDILAPESDAALRESSISAGGVKRRRPFDLERLRRDMSVDWLNRPNRRQFEFQIAWNPTLVYAATYQCVGCGRCRIRTSETRLCPAFRHAPEERASCRAKANLLRGALDGKLPLDTFARDASFQIGKSCLRCHLCATECPAQVDAAKLSFRLRSAYVAANGLEPSELFALRLDAALAFASRFAPLANFALKSPIARWALEKTLGIAQGRKLPELARRSALNLAKRATTRASAPSDASETEELATSLVSAADLRAPRVSPARRSTRKVAIVVDLYPNYFDPRLVEATLGILTRNGVDARVLERPRSIGQLAFELGDVDRAEETATRNVSILREAIRDGSELVALEPSTATCIKKEYPYFCDDADARAVYANTYDACSYFAKLLKEDAFDADSLRALVEGRRTTIAYHAPCRSLALSGEALTSPTAAQTLLSLIPDATISRLERGCCGLAGYRGLTTSRFHESLRLGTRLFLGARRDEIDFCASECSLCNLQLAQGATNPTAHAVKLLAVAYGLMPLEDAFARVRGVNPKRLKRLKSK